MQTSHIKVASHRIYYKIYKKLKTTYKKITFQNQLNLKLTGKETRLYAQRSQSLNSKF